MGKSATEFLKGGNLLITIIFVGTGVFIFFLWAKRQILRMYLISKKGMPEHAGSDASKCLKKEIEESFDHSENIQPMEPKLICDQSNADCWTYSSFIEERDDASYKYRRKAFDLMNCLDDLLCRVNICLSRKPKQTVREHIKALQSQPYAPFQEDAILCEKVVTMYEHARFGAMKFSEREYNQYSRGVNELYSRVHQKLLVPGSLLVTSDRQNYQQKNTDRNEYLSDSISASHILSIPQVNSRPKSDTSRSRDKIS